MSESWSREATLLARCLSGATRALLCAPRAVLLVGLVLAGLSLVVTVLWLGFKTSRLDLLNPKSEYNQRWLAYLDEFGTDDDAVVVVEGPDAATVRNAVDRLCTSIESEPQYFHTVLSKIDVEPLRRKALHYLSAEQLQRVSQAVEESQPAIAGNWNHLELSNQWKRYNDALEQLRQPESLDHQGAYPHLVCSQLADLVSGLANSLDGAESITREGERPAEPGLADDSAWQESRPPGFDSLTRELMSNSPLTALTVQHGGHLLFNEGRTGILLVRLTQKSKSQLGQGSKAHQRLRELLDQDLAAHPEIRLGLTGLPILENDEMSTSQKDMVIAGLVSLLGVAALFVAGFGGIRLPLLTVAALLVGMAWSFGYVTLAVGHLNILSISFSVILIGLGIDFGIHYVARYAQLRTQGSSTDEALPRTAAGVGPGIITGGVTTALAFFTAGLTQFTGVAELGLIAGGGILLTIVAALIILPALIRMAEPEEAGWCPPRPLPFSALCFPCTGIPRVVVLVIIAVTAVLAFGVTRLRFDHNLLHLQAEGLDSVAWEHRLLDSSDRSVWFAVSVADSREELFRKKAEFEKLSSVHHTEEIASLLPLENSNDEQAIRQLNEQLSALPDTVPLLPVTPRAPLLVELQRTDSLAPAVAESAPSLAADLQRVRRALEDQPWSESARMISQFQQSVAIGLLQQLKQLKSMATIEAPAATDLPTAMLARFVGRRGRLLLRVYGSGNIWDMDALSAFVGDLESVDPQVTGHPIQTFYASQQMQASYIHAAIYSALAVAIILMLDFRSLRLSLLAMAPMTLGLLQLFGILGWLGIPLNPANMIVLPLILGIGIDDGVHVVHDFLGRSGRYRVSPSTAAAVVLTSATTMVGFGSMMLARHRGLQSLGQVLTLGVLCCLVTSLAGLPALLSCLDSPGADEPPEPARQPTSTSHPVLRSPRRRLANVVAAANRRGNRG